MGPAMLTPGTRLDRFELLAVLGRGGMGEVWRARDGRLGREVALKLLPEHLAGDPERVDRFEREARALAALNHPNVAQIYELGEACPRYGAPAVRFLIMELLEGETVASRISRGPIPLEETLALAVQMARALQAAHDRGVVHRDLKPANVIVRPDGQVKVLDFGLARFVATGRPATELDVTAELSMPGAIIGTPSYMAPEQLRGEEVDGRADVWALGCCLGEMLGGVRVFGDDSLGRVVGRVLEARADLSHLPAEPSGAAPRADPALPGAGSATPAADRGRGRLPRPAGHGEPAAVPRRRRRRAAVLLAAAGALLLGALGVWLGSRLARSSRPVVAVAAPGQVLRVAVKPGERGAARSELARTVEDELLRALTSRKVLAVVTEET